MSATENAPTDPIIIPALLIDVKEVARRLDLSERTVWRLHSAAKLPKAVSIGGKSKRWRIDEINAWVDAGCPARSVWEAKPKSSHRR